MHGRVSYSKELLKGISRVQAFQTSQGGMVSWKKDGGGTGRSLESPFPIRHFPKAIGVEQSSWSQGHMFMSSIFYMRFVIALGC